MTFAIQVLESTVQKTEKKIIELSNFCLQLNIYTSIHFSLMQEIIIVVFTYWQTYSPFFYMWRANPLTFLWPACFLLAPSRAMARNTRVASILCFFVPQTDMCLAMKLHCPGYVSLGHLYSYFVPPLSCQRAAATLSLGTSIPNIAHGSNTFHSTPGHKN